MARTSKVGGAIDTLSIHYVERAYDLAFAGRLKELIEGELSLKRFNVLDRFH